MNKKLIVSAMSLAMAGGMGLANADVNLYGQIDLSLLATDSDADGYKDDINMKSQNSAFGIKGTEDLGNGLSAFFKLEWETDVANANDDADNSGDNTDGLTGRDQYLGLGMDSFGKLTFGTTSTAYKSPSKQIDPFYRTTLQARTIGLQSNLHSGKGQEGEGRGTNMVRYDSPSLGGLMLTATYQFDSNKQDNPPPGTTCDQFENCEDDDPYSVGATFKANNLYLNAAYISTQRNDDAEAAEFVARYSLGDFEFHGIYELDLGLITAQANNGLDGGTGGRAGSAKDDGADIWSLGGSYTLGNNLIALDYGQRSDSSGKDGQSGTPATDADNIQEYDVWRVAAYHSFSKRTRVYAGYSNTDYNQKGEDDRFALGMRHNF
jgi:predicted porin